MLNVYICEDNKEQLIHIKNAVKDTIGFEELEMKLALATNDPYELLDEIKVGGTTGLYFLDVDLGKDINGIQLGEQIRKYDPRGFIVFITTHAELSYLTFKYKVEALDYIIKDDFKIVSTRIRQCIMNTNEKYNSNANERGKIFRIKSKDKITQVEYNKILFFETSHTVHKVVLYGDDRQIEFYGNMKDIEDKLDERFIRCHRSYIVNKDRIKEVDKKNRIVTMDNEQECFISVRGLKHLR